MNEFIMSQNANYSGGTLANEALKWKKIKKKKNNMILQCCYFTASDVVVLLFYVHGKHLRSCRDGRLT